MSTRIFAAYNAYLAIIQTALPAGFQVLDGPQTGYPDQDLVIVGCQDPMAGNDLIAVDTGAQNWITVGPPQHRDETFIIWATYVAWTGDNDFPSCRARADTNISLIETAVRADLTLGGALTNPGWAGIAITQMKQVLAQRGVALHIQFALACRARI